ncbi:unnamed protein product [Arctogadus glacialis]
MAHEDVPLRSPCSLATSEPPLRRIRRPPPSPPSHCCPLPSSIPTSPPSAPTPAPSAASNDASTAATAVKHVGSGFTPPPHTHTPLPLRNNHCVWCMCSLAPLLARAEHANRPGGDSGDGWVD